MPEAAIKKDSPFWQRPATALLEQLATGPDGVNCAEAALRLARFGPNLIHSEHKKTLILQFLAKFRNPLVIILLTASALSAFTGDAASFFIIGTIVLISVFLDFVQEYRAGQAADRLRLSVAVRGQVLRDGKRLEIPLAEMVPGDVALLAAGDLIPCDGRVLEAKDFFVNQALLTGEASPVEKSPAELPEEPDILAAGNTVLLGTSVISGMARVQMCRTGQNTELGEIADTLLAKAPPTAFEEGTHHFGLLIMRKTILLVLFVLLAVFHAGETLFHTGWFIESMATQVLVIFIIRTRGNPFKSRPNSWLIGCSLAVVAVVAVAAVLPFTSAGVHLGFVAPPAFFFMILTAMVVVYLLSAEGVKRLFFRRFATE